MRLIETGQRMAMELLKRVVGPWSLNAYALLCPETGESLLVDSGEDPPALHRMLMGTKPRGILVTHCHADHIGALHAMRTALNVPVLAYPGTSSRSASISADRWIADGECLSVGIHRAHVVHAPGHTDDQVCLDVQNSPIMIVGDMIFEGGPGKTWSPSDFRTTLKTLERKVLSWPDSTICYPGHGPSFCLGDKRKAIETFIRQDHKNFFGDATWEM